MPALSSSVIQHDLCRLLRRTAHLALLASLGVIAFLPAFDHHAAEYNPWHGHLTFAGADLPYHHEHPYAEPHAHPADTSAPSSGVVFTPNTLSGVVSLLSAFDQVVPPVWLALLLLAAVWLMCGSPRLFERLSPIPFPDPPPRLALG